MSSVTDRALGPPPVWRRLIGRQETAAFICLVALLVFFSLTADNFFSTRNFTNVLGQASLTLIAGIGCAVVFISGEVDISIGSLLATVALPLIVIMNDTNSLLLGVAGAMAVGLAVGVINGFLSAYLGINSLIVTLGMMFTLRGGVYLYTGQRAIADDAGLDSFIALSDGRLFDVLPYSAVIAIILLGVFVYVLRFRRFGRQIYAVGGNREVARLAGYDVRRVKFTCFVISSLLATCSGIILAARVGSAQHIAGLNFEFQVVAATVLGGVSLSGGIGSLGGMTLGVLILQFLSNGLRGLSLPTEWQLVITGAIIIAAVALDELKRRRAHGD
ncbi:MAG: ABC transporter permease [Ancalomicrobiaceae bacterium]|nr:ABC transporter permease [Ancalomicrobiaceae bacterium]